MSLLLRNRAFANLLEIAQNGQKGIIIPTLLTFVTHYGKTVMLTLSYAHFNYHYIIER